MPFYLMFDGSRAPGLHEYTFRKVNLDFFIAFTKNESKYVSETLKYRRKHRNKSSWSSVSSDFLHAAQAPQAINEEVDNLDLIKIKLLL